MGKGHSRAGLGCGRVSWKRARTRAGKKGELPVLPPSPSKQGPASPVQGWWTKPHKECQGLGVPRASRLRAQSTGKARPRTLSEGLCGPLGACPGGCWELAWVLRRGTPRLPKVHLTLRPGLWGSEKGSSSAPESLILGERTPPYPRKQGRLGLEGPQIPPREAAASQEGARSSDWSRLSPHPRVPLPPPALRKPRDRGEGEGRDAEQTRGLPPARRLEPQAPHVPGKAARGWPRSSAQPGRPSAALCRPAPASPARPAPPGRPGPGSSAPRSSPLNFSPRREEPRSRMAPPRPQHQAPPCAEVQPLALSNQPPRWDARSFWQPFTWSNLSIFST